MLYALLPVFTVSSAGKFLSVSSDEHKMALFRCICFELEGGSGELFHKTRGKMSSCLCLGIEDTFRTAATEVSLLAGSEEFNATKLFEVGKNFPPFSKTQILIQCFGDSFCFCGAVIGHMKMFHFSL